MCLLGGDHQSHCLFLDALWWLSNNPCVPNCDPHTAPQGLSPMLKCLLPPSRSTKAASFPPPKCLHHPVDAFIPPFVPVSMGTPNQELHSAGSHLPRGGPKHCWGQEMLILVQERVCRAWFYLLLKYGAVQTLVSPCHQQWSRSSLHFLWAWVEVSLYKVVSHLGQSWVLCLDTGFSLQVVDGRVYPTSVTWSFVNKGLVLGTSRADTCRPHRCRSHLAAHPTCPALVAVTSW